MLRKTKFYIFASCFINVLCYSQEYETYEENRKEEHFLLITNDTLTIKYYPYRGEGTIGNVHYIELKGDFLIQERDEVLKVIKRIDKPSSFLSTDKYTDSLIHRYENSKFLIKSKNELLHITHNRPYFKKEFLDSVLSTNELISVNQELFLVPEEKELVKIKYEELLKQGKKLKRVVLDGKRGYEKYGFIGIRKVREYTNDRKYFKQLKRLMKK